MKITTQELKEGVEVDCGQIAGKVMTIKYDPKTDKFVLAEAKSGNIIYSYDRLKQLVKTTNQLFKLHDKAIEEPHRKNSCRM